MTEPIFPLLVEPGALEPRLGDGSVLIADLCKWETYAQYHIPGAVHLEYARLVQTENPRMGLLPSAELLGQVFSGIGMTPDIHVVAYDDEGGGRACRMIWTLHAMGHYNCSLLNGGIHAWANEHHPMDGGLVNPQPTRYETQPDGTVVAERPYIVDHLGDSSVRILDVRTPDEFAGRKNLAARNGHIPGAVNYEWTRAMDRDRFLRLRPVDELRGELAALGITPDREVICYCQTHHRSAHSYVMLRTLGFERVRGYPGSWSDWGNQPDTPVEV